MPGANTDMHWSIDSQTALSLSALRATHMLLRGVPTPTLAAELSLDGYALQPSEPSPFTSLTLLMQQPCGDGFATPYSPPAAVPSLLAAAMPGMPPAPAPPFLGEAVPFLQAAEAVLHDNAMPSPESIRPVSAGRGDSPTPLAMPPTGTVTHGFFWGPAHSQGPPSRASAGAFSAAPIYDGSRAGAAPACSTPDQQMLWHGATTASLPLFGDLWPQFAADGPFEGAAPAPAGPAPGLSQPVLDTPLGGHSGGTGLLALRSQNPQWGSDNSQNQISSWLHAAAAGTAASLAAEATGDPAEAVIAAAPPAALCIASPARLTAAATRFGDPPKDAATHPRPPPGGPQRRRRSTLRMPSPSPSNSSADMHSAKPHASSKGRPPASHAAVYQAPTEHDGGRPSAARYGKKRDTLSPETKTAFYQWMVDHMDDPYPKECDRVALTNGTMSKQAFKWWFSNHRHRSLEQYDDDKGNRCFRPAAPFVKACRRLGISIPWDIPADTRGRTQVRQR